MTPTNKTQEKLEWSFAKWKAEYAIHVKELREKGIPETTIRRLYEGAFCDGAEAVLEQLT
jgi:hypothetical protein